MAKKVLGFLVVSVITVFACGALFGIGVLTGIINLNNPAEKQAEIEPWKNQDGHAVVGDLDTPRFTEWLVSFFKGEGYTVTKYDGWYQAVKKDAPTASWGEWGDNITLKQVDGLYNGKAIFVAMRNSQDWVKNSNVQHFTCSGTFIPSYQDTAMNTYLVENSTIVQFDGNSDAVRKIVEKFASEWAQVREDYEGCVAK